MAIDRIDWHWDSITDAVSDDEHWERAGAHIGYYIEWAFRKGFENPEIHGSSDEIEEIFDSGVNGVHFLIDYCDTKFWDDDLNEEGQRFTSFAYDKYVNDFEKIVGHKPYTNRYNQEDLEAVSKYLDELYEEYLKNAPQVQTLVQKNNVNTTTVNVEKKDEINKSSTNKAIKNNDKAKLVIMIISVIAIITFLLIVVFGAILSSSDHDKKDNKKVPVVDPPKINVVKFK